MFVAWPCRFRTRILAAWLPLLLLFEGVAVGAAEWQSVFKPYQVLTLHLEMDENDWDRIRMDQPIQNESWVPEIAEALFWTDGETPMQVTVRRKGQSDIPLPENNPQK